MKLEQIYVRFFRSFNFDYERKTHPASNERDWERTDLGWYPFIRLDVDPRITAVVGANESGKSHLLDAVQKLLTDEQVDRQDFCRYSDLYSVERGERRVSDFAGRFRPETDEDKALMTTLGYSGDEELCYIRSGSGDSFVFTRNASDQRPLSSTREVALRASFPQVFRLETEVGELWWHDEDEFGIADVTGFRPQKLWLSSANGTASSRANLEFGVWVTDPILLRESTRFLAELLRDSENLDPDEHDLQPELVKPDYDDTAFAEAFADYECAEEDPQ